MIFSIVLGLVVLLIVLDSIGSKQVRRLIINKAKSAFEYALAEDNEVSLGSAESLPRELKRFLKASQAQEAIPPLTLRMKLKGAVKAATKKSWTPIEQKLFLSYQPASFISYQDLTLGFLISQKQFTILNSNEAQAGTKVLSVFSKNRGSHERRLIEGGLHYLAMLPWQPNLARSSFIQWKGTTATLVLGKRNIKGEFRFNKKGLIQQLSGTFSLKDSSGTAKINFQFNYSDYRSYDHLMVPFHLKVLYWQGKSTNDLFEFDVTDLVYNEDFAWW